MTDRYRTAAGMLPAPPDDLYHYQRLRAALPRDSYLHGVYGPLEHGQFTEELTRANPLMALPMAAAIPAYTAGKATGMIRGARSPASWDEIFEAYKGLWRGLKGMLPAPDSDEKKPPSPPPPPKKKKPPPAPPPGGIRG